MALHGAGTGGRPRRRLLTWPASAGFVLTAVSAACSGGGGGDSAKAPTTPAPAVLMTLSVSLSPTSIPVGQTSIASASGLDQRGSTIATGTIAWTSSNTAVASVSPTGTVSGIAVGQATIVGAAGTVQGQAAVTITQAPVATVTVTPSTVGLSPGDTRQLSAMPYDLLGLALTGRTITWTSSDTTRAKVSATGLVTGVAVGAATVTATAEGKSGTAAVTVAIGPQVTAIAPNGLVPGTTATITGVRFGAGLTDNVVLIRNVAATVTAASATQLSVTVPCLATGAATVQVVTGGAMSPASAATITAEMHGPAIGQSFMSTSACVGLTAASGTARYLVTVLSTGTSAASQSDFELRGNIPGTAAAVRAPAIASLRAAPSRATTAADLADREHFERLEAGRRLYEQLRASGFRSDPVRRTGTPAAPARAIASLGDRRTFYYNFTSCADTTQLIRATAIYIGTKAVIWEDSANTLQTATDASLLGYYRRMGQIFDQDQYDAIRTTFGDPLLRDAQLDADGRVNMIFTQRVNSTSAAAYVAYCDQYPRTAFASVAGSNMGEFFYSRVPTLSGSNAGDTRYPDGWFAFTNRTVVHEVKHIASASARMANASPTFEESWLEEGTARHAEEVWVRAALHHAAWQGNSGYGTAATNGVFCDFNTTSAACNANDALRRPSYGMQRHFNEILPKMQQPWNWSIYGDATGQTGSVFYQTVWSLVRYAIDRYAASDAAFFGPLNNSRTTGMTNLATVAGVPADRLLAGWSLAMYADDYPGLPSSPDIAFPTWNLRDIYAALNADPSLATRFTTPYPLVPTPLSFGSFAATQTGVRGGAAAYYVISGTMSTNQMLDLRAPGGGTASNIFRIAVARLP